uniref:Uncharacterized protein n=1 Tax=Mus musculus TaxID=10090 RepID=Q8C8L4_MOUSE|nr:unnamed protein product [Mus musculus]
MGTELRTPADTADAHRSELVLFVIGLAMKTEAEQMLLEKSETKRKKKEGEKVTSKLTFVCMNGCVPCACSALEARRHWSPLELKLEVLVSHQKNPCLLHKGQHF